MLVGPGNYSTTFPDKQDRAISVDEELLAQSNEEELESTSTLE